MVIHSQSELETFQIAENLLANNNIFALSGPLGAGKTRFAKGLAQALGITDNIISLLMFWKRNIKFLTLINYLFISIATGWKLLMNYFDWE